MQKKSEASKISEDLLPFHPKTSQFEASLLVKDFLVDQISGLLHAEAGVSGCPACLPALSGMCTEGLG